MIIELFDLFGKPIAKITIAYNRPGRPLVVYYQGNFYKHIFDTVYTECTGWVVNSET